MSPTDHCGPSNLLDAVLTLERQAGTVCRPAEALCHSDCCTAWDAAGGRVVAVTLPDLIALAAYLEQPTDEGSLRQAVAGLIKRHCTISPLTGTYMLTGSDGRCPFLSLEGSCTVYTARPLLCRAFFHCQWAEGRLKWDEHLDNRVMEAAHSLALDLGRQWRGHAGLLWRRPWRYDHIQLEG